MNSLDLALSSLVGSFAVSTLINQWQITKADRFRQALKTVSHGHENVNMRNEISEKLKPSGLTMDPDSQGLSTTMGLIPGVGLFYGWARMDAYKSVIKDLCRENRDLDRKFASQGLEIRRTYCSMPGDIEDVTIEVYVM